MCIRDRPIRLREKNKDKLTKVLHDKLPMDYYSLFEGKHFALQKIAEPESPKEDEFLCMIRYWDPSTWELSPLKEIYIERNNTLEILGAKISSLLAIPPEVLQCCKISSPWSFSRIQLPHEKWTTLSGNSAYLCSAPFFLTTDGCLFIVKNKEKKERDLTEEERQRFAAFDYEVIPSEEKKSNPRGLHKEKAMVITVKKQSFHSIPVSYTHLRAHETSLHLVCRLLLEKKKKKKTKNTRKLSISQKKTKIKNNTPKQLV
eukprot:TRINITY_DN7897_c0_g1_i2.p1 TRINITY_DN7897_c0_g1~~TRINITY_DN7897_c0_g1_i2.p1  ORF type:complete len:259 (-),score=51.37 TRINITY_DN7897_c0_g1_i2:47-823(-)